MITMRLHDYCDSEGVAWSRSVASRHASPVSATTAHLPKTLLAPVFKNSYVDDKQLPQPPTKSSSQRMRCFTAAKLLYVLLR